MSINMLKCMRLCINNLKPQTATLLCNQNDIMMQQSRNTFVLKRRFPVPLMKKYQTRPVLKHKYFIYELVEYKNCKKHPQVDLILLDNVRNVGEKGEIITLTSLRAYNQFLLPKLAVYATPENIKKYAIEDVDRKKFRASTSPFVEKTLMELSRCYLSVKMNMEEPWTIEKWHISACFRLAGYMVPQHAITLPEKAISGPNLSIENKEFYVVVKINNSDETKVRCRLHHYSADPFKIIYYDVPYWQTPSIAIFPEDQEVLNTLPKHPSLRKTSSTE
nr:PREDICTED: 39S ribosomal protein L9, mitochondrial [Megachile rotundata]XP_012145176.1 PREDICTED: 39S ribosomal protein L9, mitochondrial [Megachile rotundata]XP_012145177.1 PREDICTED: 39S ribosomal protein L9, mitochondrial [Megachile rotundata]